ncbi:MAG: hypothetical protein ABSA12_14995 [Verrucomicrobiia bacterium]|jgi:hypothetical protein
MEHDGQRELKARQCQDAQVHKANPPPLGVPTIITREGPKCNWLARETVRVGFDGVVAYAMVFAQDLMGVELLDTRLAGRLALHFPADDVAVLDEELHESAAILRRRRPTRQKDSATIGGAGLNHNLALLPFGKIWEIFGRPVCGVGRPSPNGCGDCEAVGETDGHSVWAGENYTRQHGQIRFIRLAAEGTRNWQIKPKEKSYEETHCICGSGIGCSSDVDGMYGDNVTRRWHIWLSL